MLMRREGETAAAAAWSVQCGSLPARAVRSRDAARAEGAVLPASFRQYLSEFKGKEWMRLALEAPLEGGGAEAEEARAATAEMVMILMHHYSPLALGPAGSVDNCDEAAWRTASVTAARHERPAGLD